MASGLELVMEEKRKLIAQCMDLGFARDQVEAAIAARNHTVEAVVSYIYDEIEPHPRSTPLIQSSRPLPPPNGPSVNSSIQVPNGPDALAPLTNSLVPPLSGIPFAPNGPSVSANGPPIVENPSLANVNLEEGVRVAKKQKNDDKTSTTTKTADDTKEDNRRLPHRDILILNPSPNTNPNPNPNPVPSAAPSAVAVDYKGEVNIVLADEKLVPLIGTILPQCWGCQGLVWDCQIPPCAHVACKSCVNGLYASVSEAKCPMCKVVYRRSQWENLSPAINPNHKVLAQVLYGLKIKCPEYQHRGCTAVIDYSEGKSHLDKTCKYSVTRCEFCNLSFKTCEMADHGRHCKRWIKCAHCKTKILESDQPMHDSKCPKRLVQCPNVCNVSIQFRREQLADHLRVCAQHPVLCPIPFCPRSFIPRCQLSAHIADLKIHTDAIVNPADAVPELIKALSAVNTRWAQLQDKAGQFPVSFCEQDRTHIMKYSVAAVSHDLPSCAKCAEQLEPRQIYFKCDPCQIIHCSACYVHQARLEDGKSRNEHWASAGLNPPAHELDFPPNPAHPAHPPNNRLANFFDIFQSLGEIAHRRRVFAPRTLNPPPGLAPPQNRPHHHP